MLEQVRQLTWIRGNPPRGAVASPYSSLSDRLHHWLTRKPPLGVNRSVLLNRKADAWILPRSAHLAGGEVAEVIPAKKLLDILTPSDYLMFLRA